MNPTTVPRSRLRRILILLVLIAAIVIFAAVWQSYLQRPLVHVAIPSGADSLELSHTNADGSISDSKVTHSTKMRLATGPYEIAAYKDDHAVGFSDATVRARLSQTLTGSVAKPTAALSTVMHQHAAIVAPLGNGYLFVDSVTRGVFYTDPTTTTDVSNSFLLSQTSPQDPTFTGTYSTVIAMQPMEDGSVAVTTTTAVFDVKSPNDVTRLPSYMKDYLYFTSSSYDATTHRLYLLAANRRQIYYYDINTLGSTPQVLTNVPLDVNRISAGGGKVVVYFDDIPSLEPAVVKAYATTHQLAPIIYNDTTGKQLQTLSDWQGTTMAALSPDGRYLTLKKKFATTMTIQDLEGGNTFTAVAPDTNALIWQGGTLYFGRGSSLWSITPGKSSAISLVAPSGSTIIQLQAAGNKILATTNDYYVSVIADNTDTNSPAEQLRTLNLQTSDYFIAFTATGSQIHIDIETPGNSDALDDAAIAASKANEYAEGTALLKGILGKPGVSVSQKDTSITTPYENALIPTDSGESE